MISFPAWLPSRKTLTVLRSPISGSFTYELRGTRLDSTHHPPPALSPFNSALSSPQRNICPKKSTTHHHHHHPNSSTHVDLLPQLGRPPALLRCRWLFCRQSDDSLRPGTYSCRRQQHGQRGQLPPTDSSLPVAVCRPTLVSDVARSETSFALS